MKLSKKSLLIYLFITAIVLLAMSIDLPYYVYKPGMTSDLNVMVEVEDEYESNGELHLVTVSSMKGTPFQLLLAKILPFHEISPAEEAIPKGFNDEGYRRLQLKMMESSKDAAKYVALNSLNRDVSIEFTGVYVMNVVADMPADGKLVVGDRIYKVDNQTIKESYELVSYIREKSAGETVKLEYERDGQIETVELVVKEFNDQEGKVGIGIQLVTDQKVVTKEKIIIHSERIGGPSAGVMFALEIYDKLTEADITQGYRIAGTGELDFSGNVHRIGGIDKKIVAADREKIDIFFAPNENGAKNSNYEEAKRTAEKIGTKMKIVPIDTFDDALNYLAQLER